MHKLVTNDNVFIDARLKYETEKSLHLFALNPHLNSLACNVTWKWFIIAIIVQRRNLGGHTFATWRCVQLVADRLGAAINFSLAGPHHQHLYTSTSAGVPTLHWQYVRTLSLTRANISTFFFSFSKTVTSILTQVLEMCPTLISRQCRDCAEG